MPPGPDPDRYEDRHAHADVLVVGAGPAGLAAALAAGTAGARVVLADQQNELGGALLDHGDEIDGAPALDWVTDAVARLEAMPEVRILTRTTVFGYYDHNYLAAVERVTDHLGVAAPARAPRERLWQIRAKQVVLATGAHERPIVFTDNDRPGVMLTSAARAYAHRYAVLPGRRAVVFTNNDSAYGAALDLAAAGVEVAAIVDARPQAAGDSSDRARAAGVEVLSGHAILATHGVKAVRGAVVAPLDVAGEGIAGNGRSLDCDLICVSGGWSPVVHLFSQSKGALRYDAERVALVPGQSAQAERSAGAANGALALVDCLAQGFASGTGAAEAAGFEDAAMPEVPAMSAAPRKQAIRPLWVVPAKKKGAKRFVDFASDVTAADIGLAAREGYRSVEHLKRYTTAGMGPEQGKTGNVNALAILARETGGDIPGTGTTTFRPPFTPVSFGAIAGRRPGPLYDPERKTPMHGAHEEAGAAFEDFGHWQRPQHYSSNGASLAEAMARECRAVRTGVGIVDVSTLGKIDIRGRDAVTLLNRVYTNKWDKLAVGRCRYGIMLHEDGMVFDDGVTARLGEHHFHMTTTTGGAAGVYGWMDDLLQSDWPELEVYLTSVSTQWAAVAVAGPKSRALMSAICPDIDLSAEAMPFMSVREGTVAGIPARVFTISFTGELGYEVNVPSSHGAALWRALLEAGEAHGIMPFGVEAMDCMRAEKGHFVIGRDTDGTQTPDDLGLDWLVNMKKGEFLGRRSLSRPDSVRPDRNHMVGLLAESDQQVLPEGGQIVVEARPSPPMKTMGHVTTSYLSTTLGRSIALAVLRGGHARHGETVTVWSEDKAMRAVVCDPKFYDPEGARLKS